MKIPSQKFIYQFLLSFSLFFFIKNKREKESNKE